MNGKPIPSPSTLRNLIPTFSFLASRLWAWPCRCSKVTVISDSLEIVWSRPTKDSAFSEPAALSASDDILLAVT